MNNNRPLEYGRIKVNTKTLDDAILNLGSIKKTTKGQISKESIYQALLTNDICKLREISNYFYKINGIYSRVCNCIASMYRYDWYIVPQVFDESVKNEKRKNPQIH